MKHLRITLLAAALSSAAFLSACGGGDGPGVETTTISGTAAIGKPAVSAPVSVTCAFGSGSATTRTDGSYQVTTGADAVAPCLVKVTLPDGTAMYSVTTDFNQPLVANVTPLTTLLVTYLSNLPGDETGGTTPEAWFKSPRGLSLLSDPDEAKKRIKNGFIPFVEDLTGIKFTIDFLTQSFKADDSSKQDQDLEDLQKKGFVDKNGRPSEELKKKTKDKADKEDKVKEKKDKPKPKPTGAGS